jgi:hypothetical protein
MKRMAFAAYTSHELTHFVGRSCASDQARYDLMLNILREGQLRASGIPGADGEGASEPIVAIAGLGRLSDETAIRGQIVCFCDIPLSGIGLHMSKYGSFGIAFRKTILIAKGANPVFYVVKDAALPKTQFLQNSIGRIEAREYVTRAEIMDRIHAMASSLSAKIWDVRMRGSCDEEFRYFLSRFEDLWWLLYKEVFAFVKTFDGSESVESPASYYMEREWRVAGNVSFELREVARIILPTAYVDRFRADVPDFSGKLAPSESAKMA